MEIQIGERVKAVYNSGVYIGEVIGFSERMPKAKVRVLAVLKHPDQGDLHHPRQANVAMFHVRKALAEREVALVFLRHLEPYEGSIPDYRGNHSSKLSIDRSGNCSWRPIIQNTGNGQDCRSSD